MVSTRTWVLEEEKVDEVGILPAHLELDGEGSQGVDTSQFHELLSLAHSEHLGKGNRNKLLTTQFYMHLNVLPYSRKFSLVQI